MPYLIVEYDHDPPVTDEQLVAYSSALEDCLGVRGITRLRSWVSNDRRRGFCECGLPERDGNSCARTVAFRSANRPE